MRKENVIKINTSFRPSSPRRNVVRGIGAPLTLYPTQKHCGMTECEYRRGFTLIELLVVVLIIGILAAVAVPQYKIAVVRSRASALLPLMKSIADAEEVYYMANGIHTANTRELDVDLPETCEGNLQYCVLGDFMLDLSANTNIVLANYCPGHLDSWQDCADFRDFQIQFFLFPSTQAGAKRCLVYNDSALGERICRTLFQ